MLNDQNRKRNRIFRLDIGNWDLFGIWSLEFGA